MYKERIITYKLKTKLRNYEASLEKRLAGKTAAERFKILIVELFSINRVKNRPTYELKNSFRREDQALIAAEFIYKYFYTPSAQSKEFVSLITLVSDILKESPKWIIAFK